MQFSGYAFDTMLVLYRYSAVMSSTNGNLLRRQNFPKKGVAGAGLFSFGQHQLRRTLRRQCPWRQSIQMQNNDVVLR